MVWVNKGDRLHRIFEAYKKYGDWINSKKANLHQNLTVLCILLLKLYQPNFAASQTKKEEEAEKQSLHFQSDGQRMSVSALT